MDRCLIDIFGIWDWIRIGLALAKIGKMIRLTAWMNEALGFQAMCYLSDTPVLAVCFFCLEILCNCSQRGFRNFQRNPKFYLRKGPGKQKVFPCHGITMTDFDLSPKSLWEETSTLIFLWNALRISHKSSIENHMPEALVTCSQGLVIYLGTTWSCHCSDVYPGD